jgi:hypothetical protein
MSKIKIFISYSHEDIEYIKSLQEILKDNNEIELWTDENIKVGDKFNKKIYNQIKKCDIIIFIFSMNLIKRNYSYVKDIEIPLALIENRKRGIQILPLVVDKDSYNSVFYEILKKDFATLPEYNKQSKAINEFEKYKWWKPWKKVPNPWDVVRENIADLVSGSDFQKYLKNRKGEYSENISIEKIENFDKYITREIEVDIKKWWETNTSSCYIQGDEGVGKTFLALNFANKMQVDGIISFYLKSLEWNGCKTIREVLVKSFGFKDENEINDISEFLNGFDKSILIVLDGVNEKGALEVVDNILNDYFKESLYQEKIRFIFTTRDLSNYSNFNKPLWNKLNKFVVHPYSEAELQEAISKFEPDFDFKQFPKNLISTASIARYLKLALNLKDKFGNYTNVTKEILYWEGLKEQIENDMKIRFDLTITSENIERVLIKLINNCQIEDSRVKTNDKNLEKVFGKNFLDIENSLKEMRLIEDIDAESAITLNSNHIMIAYSIYLLNKFEKIDTTLEVEEIADRFKFYLEPYDNDFISNVPFMVFQLSLERNGLSEQNSKLHAGLLYLWLDNHNSNIYTENLKFWCERDLSSYIEILDIVEFKNKDFNRNNLQEIMLAVLCEVWHESHGQNEELKNYLKSIFSGTTSYKEDHNIARFKRGIIILAHFPTEEFLDIFAKKIKDLSEENWGMYYVVKEIILFEYLPLLFRFGYQEDIFDVLIEKDDFKELAKLYKSYSLSEALSLEIKPIRRSNSISAFVKKVGENQKLLDEFDMENFKIHEVGGLSNIACRRDLILDNEDKKKVIETLEHLLNEFTKQENRNIFPDHWVYDNFPYLLASFDSVSFNRVNSRFFFQTIKQKANWYRVKGFHLAILPNGDLPKYILSNIESLVTFEQENEKTTFLNQLIEVMLFTADEKQLESFFNYLIDELKFSTIFIGNHPVDVYIRELFGTKLLNMIHAKLNEKPDKELKETLMTYLYLLSDFNNQYLITWAIEKIEDISIKDDKKEFYRNILASSSPSKYFEDIYLHKDLKTYFYESNSSRGGAYLTYWLTREKGFYNDKPFDELIEILPLDTVGNMLVHNERYDDINLWGKYIFDNLTPQDMNDYDVFEAIKKYSEQNNDEFENYAINYLTKANDTYKNGGRHFPSLRVFEDALITLLLPINFEKSVEFYNKTKKSQHISNSFNREIFNAKKYCDAKHTKYRKEYIQSLKSDMEILHIVKISCQNNSREELLRFIHEWLSSIYSTDRLLAVSLLAWFGDDSSIKLLETIKISDDSEYVRYFASWSLEVAKQEKYAKEIYEEVLQEDNLEVISAKLYQIKPVITPMVNQWGVELNEKYELYTDKTEKYKKILIQRFWNIVSESINEDKKIEINQRRLLGYYRGEEITDANRFITGDLK